MNKLEKQIYLYNYENQIDLKIRIDNHETKAEICGLIIIIESWFSIYALFSNNPILFTISLITIFLTFIGRNNLKDDAGSLLIRYTSSIGTNNDYIYPLWIRK